MHGISFSFLDFKYNLVDIPHECFANKSHEKTKMRPMRLPDFPTVRGSKWTPENLKCHGLVTCCVGGQWRWLWCRVKEGQQSRRTQSSLKASLWHPGSTYQLEVSVVTERAAKWNYFNSKILINDTLRERKKTNLILLPGRDDVTLWEDDRNRLYLCSVLQFYLIHFSWYSGSPANVDRQWNRGSQ